MVKISIFCCSKITHKLGCSCAQCLYDLSNRTGSFERYAKDEKVEVVGLVNCPGCPSEIEPMRMIYQIDNLAEFQVHAIHFTNCMNTYCTFRYEYQSLIQRNFPGIEVILGTCAPNITHVEQEIVEKDIWRN